MATPAAVTLGMMPKRNLMTVAEVCLKNYVRLKFGEFCLKI